MRGSAAEFSRLEPANGFALIGDDFSLPHESYGHHAHSDNAEHQKKRFLCFRSGKMKTTRQPRHGKGSPSTRPLRCGPHAIVAGRRDVALHREIAQLEGQSEVREPSDYRLHKSGACRIPPSGNSTIPFIVVCKTDDSPIHFFRRTSAFGRQRLHNSLPSLSGSDVNLSKSCRKPLLGGV
jgi:hypothetical protein